MDKFTIRDIEKLMDRADALEAEDNRNPQPKISYIEFLAKREGITVAEMRTKMGLKNGC